MIILKMIVPVNCNALVSLVEEYKTESWFQFKRDDSFDHLLTAEVCCKIEAIASDATRFAGIQLPLYFTAMRGELTEVDDTWLFILHSDRIKGMTTKPNYKNNFSSNMHKLYDRK